jgi:hypothetical protein
MNRIGALRAGPVLLTRHSGRMSLSATGQGALMQTPAERVRAYRLRAEELRAASESTIYPDIRETFLRIARDYDLIADNIEAAHSLRITKTPSDAPG